MTKIKIKSLNDKLYNKCQSKGLKFNHVAEVGVYLPETSNILNFIKDGVKATLVEADPDYVFKIREYFNSFVNVNLIQAAVWDTNGFVILNKAESSSFVDELKSSPAIINDQYVATDSNKISVESITFDKIDDGTIDLISVDIEGGEWFVLKHLVSKPDVISIETHGKNYSNPYLTEIKDWMSKNNYQIWYTEKSDTVYIKNKLIELTAFEKIQLKLKSK